MFDKVLKLAAVVAIVAAWPVSGSAAAVGTAVNGNVGVKGSVTSRICTLGTVNASDSIFDVGVLADPGTGRLANNLSAPPKTLSGSFCNTASIITISATPMVAHSAGESSPAGFSASVDYSATASGWTTTPAVFSTGASSNPAASQQRPTAFTGNIVVSLSNFTTTGGDLLRLVSDPLYQGVVTITLTVAA
jgi:hypothetical protein